MFDVAISLSYFDRYLSSTKCVEVSTINEKNFKKLVMHKLIDIGKTTSWLCEMVTKKTGLYCDASYLSKIFLGKRKGEKVIDAVCEILDIERS